MIKEIASLLENKGLIGEAMKPTGCSEQLEIRLEEYLANIPQRKYRSQWIDTCNQIAVVHPETFFPFFFNRYGSRIIKRCNGKRTIRQIVLQAKRTWPSIDRLELAKDIVRFFFLLDELDLVEFRG
jgi:hypothetical protein